MSKSDTTTSCPHSPTGDHRGAQNPARPRIVEGRVFPAQRMVERHEMNPQRNGEGRKRPATFPLAVDE
jgi:hypothetical protein